MTELQLRAAAELELRKRRAERLKDYETQRHFYSKHSLDWIVDRLRIKRETIDWALLPEYQNHVWDGTPNPLKTILDYLDAGENRIGAESATGTGKTFLGALIVLWFLENFKNSLVVTSAPKRDQLSLHIWREIGRLHNRFGKGDLTTLKLRMDPGKDDWLAVGFVAGVKADEDSATKAQGFHAEHMLIILEETPGIPKPVIAAFENTSVAEHNIILAFGNPDNQMDNLHVFCTQEGTKHVRISALDHPNVVLKDPNFIPGAQSEAGLNRMLARYGKKDSPMYLSRARGISPKQSVDSLIMVDWCMACTEKREEFEKGEWALGVDVANSENGDKAAIAKGKGTVCYEVRDFQCPDSNQLGKRDVAELMRAHKIDEERVGVDGVGVGAGTVNALKEMDYEVKSLLGGAAAVEIEGEEQKFKNLRSQMWWQLREDVRSKRIVIPNDPELITDICSPKWEVKDKYIVVESKESIKQRLGRSPNKGDALVYWNWVRVDREQTIIEFLT